MKPKDLPYLLGLQSSPKTYGYQINRFDLPKEGAIDFAQWLHPKERGTEIKQASVDALRRFLSPGDVAIDIGAYSGDSTVPIALAVGKGGCVLALEPNRYIFPVLRKNSELNPAKTNIIPLMFAATPEDAEMDFQYSDSGYGNGGRFQGMSRWIHWHAFRLKVQGRNLHSFLQKEYPQLLPRIRFIKTDTEGYESEVLRSLDSLLTEFKPFLKVEVYGKLNDAQRRKLYGLISAYGYAIHKLGDDGYEIGKMLAEGDMNDWRHFDIFCVPY